MQAHTSGLCLVLTLVLDLIFINAVLRPPPMFSSLAVNERKAYGTRIPCAPRHASKDPQEIGNRRVLRQSKQVHTRTLENLTARRKKQNKQTTTTHTHTHKQK